MTKSSTRHIGTGGRRQFALVLLGSCALGFGALQVGPAGAAAARPRWYTPSTTSTTPCTKPPITTTTAAPTTTTEVATTTSAPETTTSSLPETTTSLEVQGSTTIAVAPTTVTVVHQGTQAPTTTRAVVPATLPATGSDTTPALVFGLSSLAAGALLVLRRRPVRWER